MTDLLVTGETLVDFIADGQGSLRDTETFHRRAGGAPANVAVGLARLGRPPLFWTRVAEDPFGDHLVEVLAENGVRPELIERDPDAATALAFVSLDPDAERAFSFHRNGTADTRLQPGAVDDATLEGVGWVHAGGVTLTAEPSRSATLDLMDRARDAGAVVSFDPNARPELFDGEETLSAYRRAFDLADVIKATAADLVPGVLDGPVAESAAAGVDATATGSTALARAITEQGPHTALVTRGADGAVAHATPAAPWNQTAGSLTVEHPGYPVEPVDTTGAGDAFVAGAIRSLADDTSLAAALEFANAVAALSTTEKGAMAALPTRVDVAQMRE
ncbi:MAG: carbohydrate kinase [Halorubrum sp.]